MNLDHVPSRECLIIGSGKIPKNETAQVAKEIASLSDKVVWAYRYMPTEDGGVPYPVLTQLAAVGDQASSFIAYDIVVRENPEWTPYGWGGPQYFREYEEDDLIVLWLLGDDPDTAEVDFVSEALEYACPVFVMNEGLWEVDKVDESGMYERVAAEASTQTAPAVEAVASPEPEPVAQGPCDGPAPAPEPTAYDSLDRSELKSILEARDLKADRRSIQAMIDALVADDIAQDGPVAASVAQPDAQVLPFTSKPHVLGEDDLDNDQEPDHTHPSLVQSEDTSVLLLMKQAAEILQDIAKMNATLAGVMIQITKEVAGE